MTKPTNTQDLTARYLAAGSGYKPEDQFFALLNAASHVAYPFKNGIKYFEVEKLIEKFSEVLSYAETLEPLADDKAPF